MTLDESEPNPHQPPTSIPQSSPPLFSTLKESCALADSSPSSSQAPDTSESECLPRAHQNVQSQNIGDDVRIEPKWKRLVGCRSPHPLLWSTNTIALVSGRCSYCGKAYSENETAKRRKTPRNLFRCACGILILLAVVILLSTLTALVYSNGVERILKVWGKPGMIGDGLSSWPTDFSRGINPIPCHSHNDYWRTVPLYSAISAGCIGVEADIWLFEEELYVGHSTSSLTRNRTLNSLYINPIIDILSHQNPSTRFHPGVESGLDGINGIFDTNPSQSLIFLIDFKTAGEALWPHLLSALQPLRERNYLTHLNGTQIIRGPITVVGTGNTPFHLVASEDSNPHLDVFFDAPLDKLSDDTKDSNARREADHSQVRRESDIKSYTAMNSYYASVSFEKVFGHLSDNRFSDKQMATLRKQIQAAHSKGLKARYWDLPFWPINLRNHVWDVLVQEGVDLLNVDDLKGATQKDWTPTKRWWELG